VLALEAVEELIERPHPAIVLELTLQCVVDPGAEARCAAFGDRFAGGLEQLRVDRGRET